MWHVFIEKASDKREFKPFVNKKHSTAFKTTLVKRAELGQKIRYIWRGYKETAKPIKNVLIPFLIILEEK